MTYLTGLLIVSISALGYFLLLIYLFQTDCIRNKNNKNAFKRDVDKNISEIKNKLITKR